MRIMVSIGEVIAEVEDERSYCPEVVGDLLNRAASAVVTAFMALPDEQTRPEI